MIDAHQHFWHPARGDYGWMPADDPVLSRPYGPAELAPQLAAAGISRTILVQAAPTTAETEYMLGLADATPWVAGVVGWIDFEDAGQRATLRRLAAHPKLVGVRPMIQDIPDDRWMLRPDLAWAFEAIEEAGLAFDALGFPRHAPHLHTLLARHPGLRVVIDHGLKPQLREPDTLARWADDMARLAADTTAFVKLSGLVTEDGGAPSPERLRPVVDHLTAAFGPERTMWGSDWPVARLRCEYGEWFATARALTAPLGEAAQAQIFGRTAAAFYRLPPEA